MSITRRLPLIVLGKISAVVIATLLVEHAVFLNTPYGVFNDGDLVREITKRELTLEYLQASGVFVEQDQDKEILFEQHVNKKQDSFPVGHTPVYRWDGSQWNNERDFCKWTDLPHCLMLNTTAGQTPIFLQDPKNDYWLSGKLNKNQSWESELISLVLDEMKDDHDIGFLDIGSHIGIFALNVAKTGRQVIAIDLLVGNLLRLCNSVQRGNLTENVIIFFNPFSDGHEIISFKDQRTCAVPDTGAPSNVSLSPCQTSMSFHTAMLDDILPFVRFKKAFLKIDVESFEDRVIRGGSRFLAEIDVQGILLEWNFHRNAKGKQFLEDMLNLNYIPFDPLFPQNKLIMKQFMKWPHDVLWRKRPDQPNGR